MTVHAPLLVAAWVAAVCEQLGVRYLLGGSLASVAFGEARMTVDIDMVADLDAEVAPAWLAAAQVRFVVDDAWALEEVGRRGSFQMMDRESAVRVDMFVPEWTGFDLWKWERRRRIEVDGQGIDVTGPEGIILQKLRWFEASGGTSERQWRDVVGVLKTRMDSFPDEMRKQAAGLGLTELFRRAVGDAGRDDLLDGDG